MFFRIQGFPLKRHEDHAVKEAGNKTGEQLWHIRTGAPQESHVRIEYFEVVIHAL
jgi:hypothetical protein